MKTGNQLGAEPSLAHHFKNNRRLPLRDLSYKLMVRIVNHHFREYSITIFGVTTRKRMMT